MLNRGKHLSFNDWAALLFVGGNKGVANFGGARNFTTLPLSKEGDIAAVSRANLRFWWVCHGSLLARFYYLRKDDYFGNLGMKRPGVKRLGMKWPGAKCPGIKRLCIKWVGIKCTGAK